MFTRYSEIEVVLDTNTKTTMKAIKEIWLSKYPYPQKCFTDNGRQFISYNFEKFLQDHGIEHILTASNDPTGNSIVERANKEIGVALRISRGQSVNRLLHNIWTRINLNINLSTGYAPYELFFKKPIFENSDVKIIFDKSRILNEN